MLLGHLPRENVKPKTGISDTEINRINAEAGGEVQRLPTYCRYYIDEFTFFK